MKARTDADRKLKLIMLCDQCGAGILAGVKQCPDCERPVAEIARAIAEKEKKTSGRFIA